MTDLFTAAKAASPPAPEPAAAAPKARRACWERVPGGKGFYLHHECDRCGNPLAPYGEGFSSRRKSAGAWFCRDCWRARVAGGAGS
jgi:hypothetical protein